MAKAKSQERLLAESRAAKTGKQLTNLASAKKDSVRNINAQPISEGTVVVVPSEPQFFEMPVTGSTNTYVVFVDENGINVPLGPLTRGARDDNDNGNYVKPSGNVVESLQKYSSMQEFINDNEGARWLYKKCQPVTTTFRGNPEPQDVNVWEIVYVDDKKKECAIPKAVKDHKEEK